MTLRSVVGIPGAGSVSSGAIRGVTDGSDAKAGIVGEYLTNTGSGVALTTAVGANIATVTLTPGDWDVWGNVAIQPDGTANMTLMNGSISSTSATAAGVPYNTQRALAFPTNSNQTVAGIARRFNVTVNTPVYLVATCAFSGGAVTASGFIAARRVR